MAFILFLYSFLLNQISRINGGRMKGNKEKDITQKTLERYNDVFADIINVLLFNGERVVTEDSLTDVLPGSILKMDGRIRT